MKQIIAVSTAVAILALFAAVFLGAGTFALGAGGFAQSKDSVKDSAKDDRSFSGPIDPARQAERTAREAAIQKNYKELKEAAAELADLTRKMSEDIENGSPDVISIRVFNNLDKVEKLTKRIRDKAQGSN